MSDFRDQRVLVTGGTRGIGAGITSAFLSAGATVTATYATNAANAERFREASPERERLMIEQCDVSEYAQVERLFAKLEGPPQVVISNAGIRKDAIVGMMPQEDWRRVLAVNLDGAYHVGKLAVKAMSRERYGRIVFITSPSAELGFAGQANYAASKAGLAGLMRALSKEVARRNITVNCVSPGFIETELIADISPEQKAAFLKMVPLERFGTPSDVANAVLFVASKESSYITGTTLEVTGGI